MTRIVIEPDTPFSLAAAASFGFGPNTGRPKPVGDEMQMALVTDDYRHHAGLVLRQRADGAVVVECRSDVGAVAIERQVRRVLSLDASGESWLAVGKRDAVVGDLQRQFAGLRPVLFHSPYEAACWAILSARRHHVQAANLRTRLSTGAGRVYRLAGRDVAAFPLPEQLLATSTFPGIDETRMRRLHGIAEAALAGDLDAGTLRGLEPETALERLRRLPGIGPTYATLIFLRSTGVTDALTLREPRLPGYVAHFYGREARVAQPELLALAANWRPYRTWVGVLLRVAGDRLGLPTTPD